ncbi:MAG TPA: hypothetical protein VHX88_11895 [Solirubrobacteraceae bacterium]|jgi:hypothetical protein|nr:hypothetical protein [Solirubrobacteraceae bacterium]
MTAPRIDRFRLIGKGEGPGSPASGRLRPHLGWVALTAGVLLTLFLRYLKGYTSYGFPATDWATRAVIFRSLIDGHVREFLATASQGDSMILRAPIALVTGLLGGSDVAVYRAVAVPALLAAGWLGLWCVERMRDWHAGTTARGLTLGLLIASPIVISDLTESHSEELLGAVLCVAAMACASQGRWRPTALLLGLAMANKHWALLVALPILLVLPQRRVAAALVASAITALTIVPSMLVGSISAATSQATTTGAIGEFNLSQVWWLFGRRTPGGVVAPHWLQLVAHPLIVALCLLVALVWWGARRPRGLSEGLLLMAFLLAIRALLDPADNEYYLLPMLTTLATWEAVCARRLPLAAIAWTAFQALWFGPIGGHLAPDAANVVYLAFSLPALALLGLRALAPQRLRRLDLARLARRAPGLLAPRGASSSSTSTPTGGDGGQPATISSLGKWLSRSQPSSPTTTRSSMRTPVTPGR